MGCAGHLDKIICTLKSGNKSPLNLVEPKHVSAPTEMCK